METKDKEKHVCIEELVTNLNILAGNNINMFSVLRVGSGLGCTCSKNH